MPEAMVLVVVVVMVAVSQQTMGQTIQADDLMFQVDWVVPHVYHIITRLSGQLGH